MGILTAVIIDDILLLFCFCFLFFLGGAVVVAFGGFFCFCLVGLVLTEHRVARLTKRGRNSSVGSVLGSLSCLTQSRGFRPPPRRFFFFLEEGS